MPHNFLSKWKDKAIVEEPNRCLNLPQTKQTKIQFVEIYGSKSVKDLRVEEFTHIEKNDMQ